MTQEILRYKDIARSSLSAELENKVMLSLLGQQITLSKNEFFDAGGIYLRTEEFCYDLIIPYPNVTVVHNNIKITLSYQLNHQEYRSLELPPAHCLPFSDELETDIFPEMACYDCPTEEIVTAEERARERAERY